MTKTFIEERLESLHNIDLAVVTLLNKASELFESQASLDVNTSTDDKKELFSSQTSSIFETLSSVAKELRTEVKIMDDNIGVFTRNEDGVMILPIAVDQKNTRLGSTKLQEEIDEMSRLLDEGGEKAESTEV